MMLLLLWLLFAVGASNADYILDCNICICPAVFEFSNSWTFCVNQTAEPRK